MFRSAATSSFGFHVVLLVAHVTQGMAMNVRRSESGALVRVSVDGKAHVQQISRATSIAGDEDGNVVAGRGPSCDQGLPMAPFGTECPKALWIDAMVKADPVPGKVIVDIGCNKGHDVIGWMERWDMSPNRFWNAQQWIDFYNRNGTYPFICGADAPHFTARQQHALQGGFNGTRTQTPTGVCVEPVKANVDALHVAAKMFGYNWSTPEGKFYIMDVAVSDRAGLVDFPDTSVPGQETLRLPSLLQHGTPVIVKTMDAIARELGLARVDILTIDTEGADAAVLRGATETLKHVRYLEFEVHRDLKGSSWANTTLKSVVDELDGQGFDCYWAGSNGKLLSLSHCWQDKFEFGTWSNAACVKRSDVWWGVLQPFAGGS